MKFERWNKTKLEEIVEINPRTSLKKGTVAKKVAMEHVKEFTRKISGFEVTEFKSGSKFINNDTLMARITPCLENGKTAYVDILECDEVAFGSTEFFVLRSKEGKSDSKFIYYLSISEEFRKVAIQSMTGTSGRQRAQKDSLLNYELSVPSLKEQKKIGKILSLYDEKVESNNAIISNLEELAQTLFKRWFVDFEFPNEEGKPYKLSGGKMVESELGMIPEGWEIKQLGEVYNIKYGKNLPTNQMIDSGYYVFGANGIIGYHDEFMYEDSQVIITCRGSGSGDVLKSRPYSFITNNSLIIEDEEKLGNIFTSNVIKVNSPYNFVTGSAQPQITVENISKMKIILPNKDHLKEFKDFSEGLEAKLESSYKENESLISLRDTLLSKLLSGEIELPDDMEVTDDV